jgi:hypothetical protein
MKTSGLKIICLMSLFILNLNCFSSYFHMGIGMSSNEGSLASESPTHTTSSLSNSSKKQQRKIVTKTSGGSNQKQNSSISSTTTIDEYSAYYSRARNNNLLLWLVMFVQMASSLPPELYRYAQLTVDYTNDHVLNSYLESVFVTPMLNARPYYAMQLLYISEFALVPLIFVLFYKCSTRISRNIENSISTSASRKAGGSHGLKNVSLLFYDSELSKTTKSSIIGVNVNHHHHHITNNSNNVNRKPARAHINNAVIGHPMNLSRNKKPHLPGINDSGSQNGALLISSPSVTSSNPFYQSKSERKLVVKASPYEMGVNVEETRNNNNNNGNKMNSFSTGQPAEENSSHLVHIIQHPSWRINIKQQPQLQQKNPDLSSNNNNNSHYNPNNQSLSNGQHLPFTYRKTNMFNK